MCLKFDQTNWICWSIFVFTTLDEDDGDNTRKSKKNISMKYQCPPGFEFKPIGFDGDDTEVLTKLLVNLKKQIDEIPMNVNQVNKIITQMPVDIGDLHNLVQG
ncbi:hypothetical protein QL285_031208 [Trifolium repens]|nr:hypothetical protein QL285_031208 [Trifolium repens]